MVLCVGFALLGTLGMRQHTLLKPTLNARGASDTARTNPCGLPPRNRRTANASPLVSVTRWALSTTMPAMSRGRMRDARRSTTRMRVVTKRVARA